MTAAQWDLTDDYLEGLALMAEQTIDRVELARPAWQQQAACRGSGVDFFARDQKGAALALCESCEVVIQCRAYGKSQVGVWGGAVRLWWPQLRRPDPSVREAGAA